jgi:hypothetical protein
MTRPPAWTRGEAPRLEEVASAKLQQAVAAERARVRALGHLPLDQAAAARELTEGERALRASRPRNRRWRALDKHDQEIDRLAQKQDEASARLREAEQALADAPVFDARSLAAWLAAGEKGERPAATVYERERHRDAARLLLEAVTVELDQALERRVRHVEQNRRKMLDDVRKDVNDARARLLAHVRELPALREALLAARETLTWCAAFPQPAEVFGFSTSCALGLRQPVEQTLGTPARIEYAALLQALEADGAALAESFSPEQKKQLGIAEEPNPLLAAMWDVDVSPDWKRDQLERARGLAPWSRNPRQLADEARDFRP